MVKQFFYKTASRRGCLDRILLEGRGHPAAALPTAHRSPKADEIHPGLRPEICLVAKLSNFFPSLTVWHDWQECLSKKLTIVTYVVDVCKVS
jgi:hypothetical protein